MLGSDPLPSVRSQRICFQPRRNSAPLAVNDQILCFGTSHIQGPRDIPQIRISAPMTGLLKYSGDSDLNKRLAKVIEHIWHIWPETQSVIEGRHISQTQATNGMAHHHTGLHCSI